MPRHSKAFPAVLLGLVFCGAGLAASEIAGAIPAHAQTASAASRVRGTITAAEAGRLVVTTRTGTAVTLALGPGVKVSGLAKISLAAIKPGSFIGTAALPQADGTLKALEVHVFPEAMRGAGEGHRPWEGAAGASMTNGTVGNVTNTSGTTLTVTYQGGKQRVEVSPQTPIVAFEPGDKSLLKPGAHIIAFATKAADGTLAARRIVVGLDGLVPPM